MVGTDCDGRFGTIGEDENCNYGVGVLLDLCRNAPLVDSILLYRASVGQTRGVEDANLGKMLCVITAFIHSCTYHYAVLARKLVKSGRVGLALVVRAT